MIVNCDIKPRVNKYSMRKLKILPKQRVIRKPIKKTDETQNIVQIENDFEAEYQAFIQELRNKKENNEKVTKTETTQDIQSYR